MRWFLLQTWITVSSTKTSTSAPLEGVGHREHLVVDGHDAVGSHAAKDPLAAVILFVIDRDRGGVHGDRCQAEALRRRGHLERLVGTRGVVVGDPGIELGLGALDRGEAPVYEELLAEALVEPLDLSRR